MNTPKTQRLALAAIAVDMAIQPRAHGLNQKHVEDLEQAYRGDEAVEPPAVWKLSTGSKGYKLSQGFHRIEAARRAGRTHLDCVVNEGTELECLIDAMCSNRKHGLKRGDDDKERCVVELHKVLPHYTDRQLAEKAGISPTTVGKYRKRLVGSFDPVLSTVDNTAPVKRTGSDGRSYNATKPKPTAPADAASVPEPVNKPVVAPAAEQPSAPEVEPAADSGTVPDAPLAAPDPNDPVAAYVARLNQLCETVEACRLEAIALAAGPLGRLAPVLAAAQLMSVHQSLERSRPVGPCPKCRDAASAACVVCLGTGYAPASYAGPGRKASAPKPTPKLSDVEARFAEFWAAYPYKQNRADALKAFARINPSSELLALMLAALAREKVSPKWTKDGGEFIPYPTTWLNQRRWENQKPEVLAPPPSRRGRCDPPE